MKPAALPQQHTCSTCNAVLVSFDAIRAHYNSEMHLLNVKRRVGGDRDTLPAKPVSSTAATVSRFYCSICKKTFHCARTLQDHILSKLHKIAKAEAMAEKEAKLALAAPGDADAGTSSTVAADGANNEEVERVLTSLDCFFCSHTCGSIQANLHHMRHRHHFALPQQAYINDLDGLMEYLTRKVNGYLCLVCSEHTKEFSCLRSLQRHMLHAQHTRIELTEEYEEFYSGEIFERMRNETRMFDTRVTESGRELLRGGVVVASDANGARSLDCSVIGDHASGALMCTASSSQRGRNSLVCCAPVKSLYQTQLVAQEKKQIRDARRDVMHGNKYWANVGVSMNKLHPKGYDGEGKF